MGKVIESYSGKSIPSKTYATYVELYLPDTGVHDEEMYAYAHIGTKYYLQMQVDMPKEQLAYNVPLELAQEAASSYIA
ncbi:unnamed protein product [Penicillium roqueforti FM164]|uniref:Genomic scaffold, ProqFM164S02 n=1 Tax=Penicillium roqueforti (strain FM164) TaxID=1365484 RepID=W6QAK4_PENRF|nr:unnamed protein product [Penicillium roqueforti FM164]